MRTPPSLHFAPDRVSHLFTHSFHLSFVCKCHLKLTPSSQLKFLGILPPATSLIMHVAHFSSQEFSDEPIQSLMIVIVSTVVVSVIQNSPRACWRRQSAPVALSTRSRLRKGLRLRRPRVPRLSSFLFTLLSVHFCQCCNAGTTIRLTPVQC